MFWKPSGAARTTTRGVIAKPIATRCQTYVPRALGPGTESLLTSTATARREGVQAQTESKGPTDARFRFTAGNRCVLRWRSCRCRFSNCCLAAGETQDPVPNPGCWSSRIYSVRLEVIGQDLA
ncbi:hypothetical protein V502_05611 [Pseudogymnoascus sp. VKM F-4520 (FW-2644)]|nr:hypothetical protein V502_05611 [Pseudogymnoascus sp. VKM F-4520 (FW-2644)]